MRDGGPNVEVVEVGVGEEAEEVGEEEQRDWDRFLGETEARLDRLEEGGADIYKVGTGVVLGGPPLGNFLLVLYPTPPSMS